MSRSGYTCIRYVFCWTNVLIWLTGCALLGAGIFLRLAYEGYATLLPQYAMLSADSLAIAIGVVTFLVAFFGCCGSWFQSRCLLITYFSLVVFLFVAEFFMGSLAFVFRDRLGHTMREELQNGIKEHYNVTERGPNSLIEIWDHVHSRFRCCGVVNYEDWYLIDAWPTERRVPDSCCLPGAGFDCGRTGSPDVWYSRGCSDQVHMWFVQRLHIIGIVGLCVAFIQLFGLISSMLLFCTVRHKRSTHTYKSYHGNS